MRNVTVRLPASKPSHYPVVIGEAAISSLPQILQTLKPIDSIFIIFDENVCSSAEKIRSLLGKGTLLPVPAGESSKSLEEITRLAHFLLEEGATRESLLINVGGGVLTDLAGFAASVFMRGIRCVHVPTTFLGMVDAAIGGKTGIDFGNTKNILGHYHHPSAVIEDLNFLSTLSQRHLKEGFVEVIKMAAMLDADFFAWIEQNVQELLRSDNAALEYCIFNAVRLKAATVEADERDGGRRMFLNFGHTIGHALEAASSFSMSHGEAVSAGMVAEMVLADSNAVARVRDLLALIGMPTTLSGTYSIASLLPHMQSDKKKTEGRLRFAVPREIGQGELITMDPESLVTRAS